MPGNLTRTEAQDRLARLGITPRCLSLDLAAAYVGLTPGVFLAEVEAGRYPKPSKHGAAKSEKNQRTVWDMRALDDAVDRISGRVPLSQLSQPKHAPDPIMAKIQAARQNAAKAAS